MQQQVLVTKSPQLKKKENVVSNQKNETCWTSLFSYFRGLCCGCVEREVDLR